MTHYLTVRTHAQRMFFDAVKDEFADGVFTTDELRIICTRLQLMLEGLFGSLDDIKVEPFADPELELAGYNLTAAGTRETGLVFKLGEMGIDVQGGQL